MSAPSSKSAGETGVGASALTKIELLQALRALQQGDFSARLPGGLAGVDGELSEAFNIVAERNEEAVAELQRLARKVGREGDLSQRSRFICSDGQWGAAVVAANELLDRLARWHREMARVVSGIAAGDLSQELEWPSLEGPWQGEFQESALAITGMTTQLRTFASVVTGLVRQVGHEGKLGGQAKLDGLSGSWKELAEDVNQLTSNVTTQVRAIADVATSVTKGDFCREIQVQGQGEFAALKDTINEMIKNLRDTTIKNIEQDWLKTNLAKFSRMLQGQKDLQTIGKLIFSELASVVSAEHATFYIHENSPEGPQLRLQACYTCNPECEAFAPVYRLGEGRIGHCAAKKKKLLLVHAPKSCLKSNADQELKPLKIVVLPVLFKGDVKAVIELASLQGFNASDQILLEELGESLGIVLHTIESDIRTQDLLKQSQALASELQEQQLQLRTTNEDLQEKARLLAVQMSEVEKKNRELEQARQALREKAGQLAQTSKYKSEFLANMSHELRTPLNSMLLLARQLLENQEQTMTQRQLEFAKVIYAAGNELLRLINDILDLSKIESGTVTVEVGELQFWELQEFVERNFRVLARTKNLDFTIQVDPALQPSMLTDGRRLEQILKNLLANAFKFTTKGSVSLSVGPASSGWSPENASLCRAPSVVAFAVTDTGIGISENKQKIIFEAFQQGDGSTSRKYGGTGLGLTISKEIARMLGGEIHLESKPGEGSAFTLYLPMRYAGGSRSQAQEQDVQVEVFLRTNKSAVDDREGIKNGDRVLLAIEDDSDFATHLIDMARANGFKALTATHAEEALELMQRYRPHAITLDLTLPDVDGWRILERFKEDPVTRHIPVLVISGDNDRARGLSMGALSQLVKPVPAAVLKAAIGRLASVLDRPQRSLMVVKAEDEARQQLISGLGSQVDVTSLRGGQAALAAIKQQRLYDCMVLDGTLPDMTCSHLLKELAKRNLRDMPILIHLRQEIGAKEAAQLQKLQSKLLIKIVRTPERLLDQVALHLHLPSAALPEQQRQIIDNLHCTDTVLAGKRALIVDDDIRNIFALTSLLERHGMKISSAETGQEAIDLLQKGAVVDVVLMDIMMPGFDGYKTMRILRDKPEFEALPIIAVTAKAMAEDRVKCMEAGASDYVAKPVDSRQLLSTLRAWLHR